VYAVWLVLVGKRITLFSHAHCTNPIVSQPQGLVFDETEEEKKEKEEKRAKVEPLCRLMKDVLGDRVEKVCVCGGG
jgi:hypothetical protein